MPRRRERPATRREVALGAEFRRQRMASGYPTLRSIARVLECDLTTVSAWERGRFVPARRQGPAIIAALGTGIEATLAAMWAIRDDDENRRAEERMRGDLRGRLAALRGAA